MMRNRVPWRNAIRRTATPRTRGSRARPSSAGAPAREAMRTAAGRPTSFMLDPDSLQPFQFIAYGLKNRSLFLPKESAGGGSPPSGQCATLLPSVFSIEQIICNEQLIFEDFV